MTINISNKLILTQAQNELTGVV